MRYKKLRKSFPLKPLDKMKRDYLAEKWLAGNHPLERTVLSDEKRFFVDGSDDWRSYVEKSEVIYCPRHQKKCGSIMVLPNGLLSFGILKRDFRSHSYRLTSHIFQYYHGLLDIQTWILWKTSGNVGRYHLWYITHLESYWFKGKNAESHQRKQKKKYY